ncbi:RBOHE, partial [Symbiodinium microadriaticum]
VQGPFYAPAHTAVKKPTSTILMVASGIGITPFFSVMATRVAEEQSYESDKEVYASLFKENLVRRGGGSTTTVQVLKTPYKSPVDSFEVKVMRVVWSIRDVTELMFYLDYVYELVKHQSGLQRPVIEVDVYLTGIGNQTDITYMISQTLFLLSLASKTSEYMRIHFGRPNLESTVDSIGPDKVYYCGGKALKETLNDLCAEKKIPFHPEDFDSGTHVLKDVSTFFSSLLGRTPRQQVEKARVIKRKKSMGVSKV